MKAAIISFTNNGSATAEKVRACFNTEDDVSCCRCENGGLGSWTEQNFKESDLLIFVGSCGIAVRAIAPFIKSKLTDPAVIVIDELGKNIIPILSGHIGGANAAAIRLAEKLGGNAVITTATDINGRLAIDSWAVEHGMAVANKEAIKTVSEKALNGQQIRIKSKIPIDKILPGDAILCENDPDVIISYRIVSTECLLLIPRVLTVGLGCKRGKSEEEMAEFIENTFQANGLYLRAIKNIASIDLKKEEPGILGLSEKYKAELKFYSSEELNAARGSFSASVFVKEITGVDNVCERSAFLGSGEGTILVPKTAGNGITISVAVDREADY